MKAVQKQPNIQYSNQLGLTLVELLVALAISTVITIAAFSALVVSRQGFTATDTAAQLRDNSRFASDLIQRLGVQAGYLNDTYATSTKGADASANPNPEPDVKGFNNALASATSPGTLFTARSSSSLDGSDVLILRYQASETYPGSGLLDSGMVNCAGNPAQSLPVTSDDRVVSVLHVQNSAIDNEPSLMCTSVNSSSGAISSQPIVRGVENFQVLYGVDGVKPGLVLTAGLPAANVPTRYLRADQMVVAGNAIATNDNWGRVRSIRIGMVLRGPLGSAAERASFTYYPFGSAPNASGGAKGSSMSSADDVGTAFIPTADTRLRQVVTFTVHLRNRQS